jgi:hypothetical protein
MNLRHSSFCLQPSFSLPHENGKHTGNWQPCVESHITGIAEIEKLPGINFLATMSASKRTEVENSARR